MSRYTIQFTANGDFVTGLTPTATVVRMSTGNVIVDPAPPTVSELSAANAPGVYYFDLVATYDVLVRVDGGNTLDFEDRYWTQVITPDDAAVTEARLAAVPGIAEGVDAVAAAVDGIATVTDSTSTAVGTLAEDVATMTAAVGSLPTQVDTLLGLAGKRNYRVEYTSFTTIATTGEQKPRRFTVSIYASAADAQAGLNPTEQQFGTVTYNNAGSVTALVITQ